MNKIPLALFLYVFCISAYAVKETSSISETNIPPERSMQHSARNSETYTYIKCVYRKNKDKKFDATSSWEWGRAGNTANNYATVNGHWYSSAILANMFYTKASHQEIKNVCINTLNKKDINYSDLIPYASDYTLSYYYSFWNEGSNIPSIEVGKAKLDRMVVFGDSLSDTINVYNGSYGTVPNSNTWFLGHFSNGLVWHEYLSKKHIKVPGYTWATGNAESGSNLIFSGFSQQLDSFESYMKKSNGYDIGQTLFLAMFGGNDFITGNKLPDDIVNNYKTALVRLKNLGAKQVAIFTLPDFSTIPAVKNWSQSERDKLKNKSIEFNTKLSSLINSLKSTYPDVKWIMPDLNAAFDKIIKNPASFNYVNAKDTCLNLRDSSLDYIAGASPKDECKNSNGAFIFWDNMHTTTKMHEDISDILGNEIKFLL
ncbi:SGNH/GDSL hydrolase family protein [Yersinia intermedia]|uniref:SGNH/GDSL hydrolase family protein n=2 Tax=Yersinia intermedia TaxID=631 RepID=UPI000B4120EE|nr:SGNH/GDSL hydrolase family protein [Yersinia intermedia]OVZ74359.1 thermolabile hemolysin [Yersinia intermedia]